MEVQVLSSAPPLAFSQSENAQARQIFREAKYRKGELYRAPPLAFSQSENAQARQIFREAKYRKGELQQESKSQQVSPSVFAKRSIERVELQQEPKSRQVRKAKTRRPDRYFAKRSIERTSLDNPIHGSECLLSASDVCSLNIPQPKDHVPATSLTIWFTLKDNMETIAAPEYRAFGGFSDEFAGLSGSPFCTKMAPIQAPKKKFSKNNKLSSNPNVFSMLDGVDPD